MGQALTVRSYYCSTAVGIIRIWYGCSSTRTSHVPGSNNDKSGDVRTVSINNRCDNSEPISLIFTTTRRIYDAFYFVIGHTRTSIFTQVDTCCRVLAEDVATHNIEIQPFCYSYLFYSSITALYSSTMVVLLYVHTMLPIRAWSTYEYPHTRSLLVQQQ